LEERGKEEMINFIFATLFRACYGKDPQNIAELFNFYIAQGVQPGKLYDALKEFKEKKIELFTLKIKQKMMQLTNTSELRTAKKDIARINTALSAVK
jgi:large subunit ribosomal protein L29